MIKFRYPQTRKEFYNKMKYNKRVQMYGCNFNTLGGRINNRRLFGFLDKTFGGINIINTSLKSFILYNCDIQNNVELIDCWLIGCKVPPKEKRIELGIKID